MNTLSSELAPSHAAGRTGWLIASLLMGLALAFSAAIAGGSLEDRRLHAPSETLPAAVPAQLPRPPSDPLPRVSLPPEGHWLTYVIVETEEAAAPLRAFVDIQGGNLQGALGESIIVVVSTLEEEQALRDLIASANLELMPSGASIGVIDLRSP